MRSASVTGATAWSRSRLGDDESADMIGPGCQVTGPFETRSARKLARLLLRDQEGHTGLARATAPQGIRRTPAAPPARPLSRDQEGHRPHPAGLLLRDQEGHTGLAPATAPQGSRRSPRRPCPACTGHDRRERRWRWDILTARRDDRVDRHQQFHRPVDGPPTATFRTHPARSAPGQNIDPSRELGRRQGPVTRRSARSRRGRQRDDRR